MGRLRQIIPLLIIGMSASSSLAWQKPVLMSFDENSYLGLSAQRGPHLDVRVKSSKALIDALRLYTGDFEGKFSFSKYKISKLTSTRAILPYLALSPGFKRAFLKRLWPNDQVKNGNLVHKVTYNNETLWTVSQMYTGFGNNYKIIKRVSGLRGDGLRKGMVLKIPYEKLMSLLKEEVMSDFPDPEAPALKELEGNTSVEELDAPVVSAPGQENKPVGNKPVGNKPVAKPPKRASTQPVKPAEPKQAKTLTKQEQESREEIEAQLKELREMRALLKYGSDRKGPYAEYRLRSGEAIYSSVVVRFCGIVRAVDVNRVAKVIIARNNIRDETDMPVGRRIRIPTEYLDAEFRPETDPSYIDFMANLEAVGRESTIAQANNLEGVYLVLDAGHGGRDPGADRKRVWEDDYVYDIVCRIKKRLEEESSATVLPTVLDPSVNYKVQDVTQFRRDTDEVLLTQPRYRLSSRNMTVDGVNLRWMMANAHYDRLVAKGVTPENIIFASFHADALHPSIRGSMVYIPDARVFPKTVSSPGNLRKYKEYRDNHFTFNLKTMRGAQARSMNFAANYIRLSKQAGVRVHRQKPIRSLIYRNPRRPFVPAVIKFNRIPTRVLIEICNLSNKYDQNLLKRPDFRQRVADSFVEAVYKNYGVKSRRSDRPAAKTTVRARK